MFVKNNFQITHNTIKISDNASHENLCAIRDPNRCVVSLKLVSLAGPNNWCVMLQLTFSQMTHQLLGISRRGEFAANAAVAQYERA